MEAQRDLTQIIVHVDMDAFYASVELLDDPSLRDKPFAVGHGVVSTASYSARKFGVRSGMAGMSCVLDASSRAECQSRAEFVAKKLCPQLIVISTHFNRYMELSKQIMDIFRRYDPTMCAAGCDEGYLKYVPSPCCSNVSDDGKPALPNIARSTSSAPMIACKRCVRRCTERRS